MGGDETKTTAPRGTVSICEPARVSLAGALALKGRKGNTYVVAGCFGCRVAQQGVFDRVGRADDLGVAVLPLRRPQGQPGQEAAVAVL